MAGESGVTRNIIDELHFSDIQRHQMAGKGGFTGSTIDKLQSSDIQGDKV